MELKVLKLKKFYFYFLFIAILLQDFLFNAAFDTSNILDPTVLKPFMFTRQITGDVNILLPTKQQMNLNGRLIREDYLIEMKKIQQQLLPPELFGKTTIYAYGGKTKDGFITSFPAPAVIATKNVATRITWRNSIDGKHILPVDFNHPFESTPAFKNEVPTVPHVHGVATLSSSDGQPESHWTSTGKRSDSFKSTIKPVNLNEAVFEYPNQQQAGNNWYHDHTMGITRLNVYAGLAGLYKIVDPQNINEFKLQQKYGVELSQSQTKYLIITDKSFKKNGQLFYPDTTDSPGFSSWNPEFYGNTILVNGVVWPKMTLKKGKYRFVLLNACQNRFLNIYFENQNKRIPMEMIRVDSDYYRQKIVLNELLATISSRIEFILDLTSVSGDVIMKNNANTPFPVGDVVDFFTSQIMKIQMKGSNLIINRSPINFIPQIPEMNFFPSSYPRFAQGQKVFTTLFEVMQNHQMISMFIDGVSMMSGHPCTGSTYEVGKVYDFYWVNLTPDTHPIHYHLINMQKVKQFKFDVLAYTEKYFQLNGGMPTKNGFEKETINLNPEQFRIGEDEFPQPHERIFRDTIDCHPDYVTVMRVKFAKNDGTNFNTLDLKGQIFVMHCHMLEHEDNQLMKYFCLK